MTNSSALSSTPVTTNRNAWYRPLTSPEHGVYVVLLVSFLTGAAAAQSWNWNTTLALVAAFCGFQAEHPWILQIKQRKSWKPRFLVWGGLYSTIALTIAAYLYWQQGMGWTPLLGIYLGAVIAFVFDAVFVFHREQKSIPNELITFAAVCLSAPFAYTVTTGTMTTSVLGLWLLNSLFFSYTIFTVKFRKDKQHSILPSVAYHAIASITIFSLYLMGWLAPITAAAFAIALLKFGLILWQRNWYCTAKIQSIATIETGTAFIFLIVTALSLLPAHL